MLATPARLKRRKKYSICDGSSICVDTPSVSAYYHTQQLGTDVNLSMVSSLLVMTGISGGIRHNNINSKSRG